MRIKSIQHSDIENEQLSNLCNTVKELIIQRKYQECEDVIAQAMMEYPHAPEPHNLFGLLLEQNGEHITAMKHFRASCALDPTYLPARQNLEGFGTFASHTKYAYTESDCDIKGGL